jgi:hypothetical protein
MPEKNTQQTTSRRSSRCFVFQDTGIQRMGTELPIQFFKAICLRKRSTVQKLPIVVFFLFVSSKVRQGYQRISNTLKFQLPISGLEVSNQFFQIRIQMNLCPNCPTRFEDAKSNTFNLFQRTRDNF